MTMRNPQRESMRRMGLIASIVILLFSPAAAQAQSRIVEEYLSAIGAADAAAAQASADAILNATSEKAGLSDVDYYDLVLDIAQMREAAGDAPGAESAYHRALSFGRDAFGAESLRLRMALQGVARMQAARGDALAAEQTLLESKTIAEEELGAGHPSTRDELALLASLPLPVKAPPNGEDRRGDYESSLLRIDESVRQSGEILAQGAGDADETCADPAASAAQKVVVYYGTNRKASGKSAPASFYKNEYDRDAPVKYGVVVVSLPCDRDIGAIETPQLWKLEFRANPAKHVILESVAPYDGEAAFWSAAKRRMDRSSRKEALVFIHGYNTSFQGAAMRAAQLAADIELDGAPFFYDWPSTASLPGYLADRTLATEIPQITQNVADFLRGVVERTGAERISVIAHSMGNEPFLRALKLLAEGEYRERTDRPFDEVIFASPDVNVENFKAHVAATQKLAGNMTLYASERDRALNFSSYLSNFPRAGFAREKVVIDGLVSVDTTKASAGFIGHDDFAGNGLDDLRSIVWFGARPEGRCVLSPLPNPKGVWSFAPKCDDADFKLAVTLLRRRGTAQSLADLAATRAAAEADRSLSQAEKRRRLKRADTIKSLIENLDAAFNPPSLRTRYAAAAVPAVRLSAVFGEAKPAHADGDALEIRHGDGRLDAPDTNEWAQYLASFTQGSSGASGNDAFIHDSAVLNGLQSSDVGATIEEGAFRDGRPPLIEIQASGGDAAAREWERVNAEVVRLHQAGDYAAATVKAEEALRLAEKAFGPDHPSTLASAYNLAGLYQTQRRFAESEALYLRSLNGVERVLGRDHPVTLSLVRSLAVLYHIQARYDEAERLYRRALDAWERTLGPNSFDTLVAAGNLAVLLQAKGDYDEAETLFVRSMKGLESSLGRDHRATLTAASNLGGFYHARGRYDDAEPLKRRAFEGRERIFGPDNQETLIAANNLALLYRDQGRFEEAEALLLRSFNRLEATLGPDNGSTLIAASNLASLYHVRRRYAEAEKLYRRAFEGSERAYGADHPATLTGASNLAGIFMDQGRYAEAEPLYRRAYEGSARTLGPTHQSTLLGLNNLAALFQKQGRNAEAEPLLLRALDGFLNIHGADHPLTFVTISSLAGLYRAQGLYEKAEPYYLTLLEGRERVLGAKDPSTLNTIKNYFIWRENASSARLASQWAGDARAMRLLETSLADFSGYLSAGADVARLDDPTSVESRSVELLTAFERARLAGVPGSDSAAAVFAAGAIAQRFQLSSVAAALELSSRRLADPAHRALLDRRIKLAREIEGRFKALNAMRGRGNRNAAAEATIEAEIDSLALEARNVASALAAGNEGQAEIDGAVIEGDLAGFASALDPDEAVILYSSAGEHYLAFVVTTRGAAAVSLGVDRKDIASRVSALRRGLRLPFRVVGGEEIASNDPRDLAAFDLDAAAALGDILVKPLKPHLSSVKKLVIVADGPLQSLPFGVLVEEKGDASLDGFERYKSAHYLIDRYAISVQPSVSAVRTLRAKTPRSKGDLAMLGFADPSLGGVKSGGAILSLGGIGDAKRLEDLPELPQTRSLLNTVGLALGARPEDLHYRDKAHEADFRAYDAVLPRYRMLTFATHGLVSDEIAALNLKEPALVLSLPPTVAGAARPAENDGLLLASDIVGFEMDADLVILAACNTAAADGTPGAEPLTGLAKAFMAKGARALLVSHWQADANASAALIPAMARNAETNGFAEGLAKAQRDLKNSAAYDPDPQSNTLHYAHPAIWGAFTLIGEPGR